MKYKVLLFSLVCSTIFLGAGNVRAASPVLVKDIYAGADGGQISDSLRVGDLVYLVANDGVSGQELWKSDGTAAGTVMVKDINPGIDDSVPHLSFAVGNLIYFTVNDDGTHGNELWKSDGTAAGTVMVKDINPGIGNADIYNISNINDVLYFLANDGVHGVEPWKSDGTEIGTVMLKDINLGSGDSYANSFVEFNGLIYFNASDDTGEWKMWITDGTEIGTVLRGDSSLDPYNFIVFNGSLFFEATDAEHGYELWKSDGTASGSVLVKDINPGTSDGDPCDFVVFDGNLYFFADDGVHGGELWKSDGTEGGTVLLEDVNLGVGDSYPDSNVISNGALYTLIYNSSVGNNGLWKIDSGGATLVMGGTSTAGCDEMIDMNDVLYFSYFDTGNWWDSHIWKTDGSNTIQVDNTVSEIENFTKKDQYLFFSGNNGVNGSELMSLDTTVVFRTLTYTAGSNGSISGTSPQTIIDGGSGTAVTANPDSGYYFVDWNDGSTQNPRTDTNVTSNINVTANFSNVYTLTYVADSNGTIVGDYSQSIIFDGNGSAVTAVPNANYHFVNWSDSSTQNPRTDTNVQVSNTFTANFAIDTYTLTYVAGANGTISGTSPQTVDRGSDGSAVTAVPSVGYHFVDWSDSSTQNPRTDTDVISNLSVSANFAINSHTLTYTAGPNGTFTGTSPQTVNYGSSGSTVVAVPDTGYHFFNWSDGATSASRTDINITGDVNVTANFSIGIDDLHEAWTQTSWIGGVSSDIASHAGNAQNWTEYSSKDGDIAATTELLLQSKGGSEIQTTNADFNAGTNSNTQSSNSAVSLLGTVNQVVEGDTHTCALKPDGTVFCWGSNTSGYLGDNTTGDRYVPVQVVGVGGSGNLTSIVQIAAGYTHTCALKSDGSVYCWGGNNNGQLGDNSLVQRTAPVQVLGVDGVDTLAGVSQIVARSSHTCALKSDGSVYCWGYNGTGQLGDNTVARKLTPTQVLGVGGTGNLTDVSRISAGNQHACALKSDSTVFCWGGNGNGQLGDNSTIQALTPVQTKGVGGVGYLTDATQLESNGNSSCVTKSDESVFCWGGNDYGQLGDGTTVGSSPWGRLTPVQVRGVGGTGFLTGVSKVALGAYHTCAVKPDGSTFCWGRNNYYQLGDGTNVIKTTPVQVLGVGGVGNLADIRQIAGGTFHTCALKSDGLAYCWGYNSNGQLGDTSVTTRSTPVYVRTVGDIASASQISAGPYHSCAAKSDGSAYCWGDGSSGKLGNNSSSGSSAPVQVVDVGGTGYLTSVSQVATGDSHSCALKTDGTVYCWGSNSSGQIGDNTTSIRYTPVQVKGVGGSGFLTGVSSVEAGSFHTCAVKTDNTVFCWGSNGTGQLGDNTTTQRNAPIQVLGVGGAGNLTSVSRVSAGMAHTCAAKIDGTAYCWGYNLNGRLGDNSTTQRPAPVQVLGSLTGVNQISAGDAHTCAVKSDGAAYCWGLNTNGRLGDNSTTQRLIPTQVKGVGGAGTLAGVSRIASGYAYSCAAISDGSAYCWGLNTNGQLGDNTVVQKLAPIQVLGVGGSGNLAGASDVTTGNAHSCTFESGNTVYCWGNNGNGQLGDMTTTQRLTPTQVKDAGPNFNFGAITFSTPGTFISSIIDSGQKSFPDTLAFTKTTPANTTLTIDIRAGSVGTPDGTWTDWQLDVSTGASISALGTSQYFQYRANLATTDTTATPTLSDITFNYQYYPTNQILQSSSYNTNLLLAIMGKLRWNETLLPGSDINFQLRTSPDNANWTPWCGPNDGVAGSCSSTTYFTDSVGDELIDDTQNDKTDDQYVQYKIFLLSDGRNASSISDVTIEFQNDTRTLSYAAGAHGTLSGATSQTIAYRSNGTAVTAIPDVDYHFASWSDGSTQNPRTDLDVTNNISVTANFAPENLTLTYVAGLHGSISGTTPQTVAYEADGSAVTASPDSTYHFTRWSDGSTQNPRTDTNVQDNITVTALFAPYTLTYTAGLNGTISGVSPQVVDDGNDASAVTAVSDTGYHFVDWSDGVMTASRTDTNVTNHIAVTANFAINVYSLNYAAAANGSLSGVTAQTVNHGASGSAVEAIPDSTYHLVDWSDGSTQNPRTDINVTGNINVTATFSNIIYTLSYTGEAGGTLSGNLSQSVNPGRDGTVVTAIPDAGYRFVDWSDGSTQNPRTDTDINSNISVTVNFTRILGDPYMIDINKTTDAGGTIWSMEGSGGKVFFTEKGGDTLEGTSGNSMQVWGSDGTHDGTVLLGTFMNSDRIDITDVNGVAFYGVLTFASEDQLWKSDGTIAGTVLVKSGVEVCADHSDPVASGGSLYWACNDTLWKSDGTEIGTEIVKDTNPSATGGFILGLTDVNGILYFGADDGVNGYELWKSNGTPSGTEMVRDIYAGSSSGLDSITYGYAKNNGFKVAENVGGVFYFVARTGAIGDEVWRSDGTSAGTTIVGDIYEGAIGSDPSYFKTMNGALYFQATDYYYDSFDEQHHSHGAELWKADGSGASIVKDISVIGGSSYPSLLTNVGGILYFFANDGPDGNELWRSDGTNLGTNLVKDINPGISDGVSLVFYSDMRITGGFGGELYFQASDGVHGKELWKSNGTSGGTVMMKDIFAGFNGSLASRMVDAGGTLYFAASDGDHGEEPWKTDGTSGGTVLVRDTNLTKGSAYPDNLTIFNGETYFSANDGIHGYELWKTDGTIIGTTMVKDINLGNSIYASPSLFHVVGDTLYFAADDGVHGRELWKTDGTESGTVLVKDIYIGTQDGLYYWASARGDVNGIFYFSANDGNGYELWKSDGTESGTEMVKNIYPGVGDDSIYPYLLTSMNGILYFKANDNVNGPELWRSDGTSDGTTMVKDIYPGSNGSGIETLVSIGNALYFNASNGINGSELWKSDGTVGGTVMVKDIYDGSNGSFGYNLFVYNNEVYFAADDGVHSNELWKSNGTASGTVLVKDITVGAFSNPNNYAASDVSLYFSAGQYPGKLWKTDGTESGTVLVKDIYSGAGATEPSKLTNVDGIMYFKATDGSSSHGSELWESDGTTVGTKMVEDIFVGGDGVNANARIVNLNNVPIFVADNGDNGRELWTFGSVTSYTLTYTAGANGSISGTTPQSVIENGDGSEVVAVPAVGYHFVDWSDSNTDNPRIDTNVTSNITVTANFAENAVITHTLTYTAGANGGVSGTSPQIVNDGADGTAVSAVPNSNYHFVNWSDSSTDNPRTDTNVTGNLTVTANFAINAYTLTYHPGTGGTISGTTPQTVNYGGNGTEVIAIPNPGWHFVSWDGGSTNPARTDTNVTGDITVVASFAIDTYTLTYNHDTNGTISGTTPQTIDHGSDGTAVSAVPNTGYHFVDWSDNSTDNPRTDTNITSNLTVTANFAINSYTLMYSADANGSLTGTTPQTVNHGADGTQITAVPASGYHFVNWSDNSTENPRTDTNVTNNITVTANFSNALILTYIAGSGGTITGTNPQNVSYGDDGTEVTATPNVGYHFTDWSDNSIDNPRTDTNIQADATYTANFAINSYTLTYSANANGSLTGTTSQTVTHGESGTQITAVPIAGYRFVNWSDNSTQNPRTDTNVQANLNVSANFSNALLLTYTAGPGGTITGTTPQTVTIGSNGTPVTATPNTGYHFVSWSDNLESATRTDTNVQTDLTLTANFEKNTFTLRYRDDGNGEIDGDETQTISYDEDGKEVEAKPNTGYLFKEWSDGKDSNPRKDKNIQEDLSVTAEFEKEEYTLKYNANSNGSIQGDANQTVKYKEDGEEVEALPATNYHFTNWSDGKTERVRTDTDIKADLTLTANFASDTETPTDTTYTLTYTSGGNGTLSGNANQTVKAGESGTSITAIPDNNYHFTDWSDGNVQNPRTDTSITKNIFAVANFALNTVPIEELIPPNPSNEPTTPETTKQEEEKLAETKKQEEKKRILANIEDREERIAPPLFPAIPEEQEAEAQAVAAMALSTSLLPLLYQARAAKRNMTILLRDLPLGLFGLLSKTKKKKMWGTVYDSATGDPIPLVSISVIEAATGKTKETKLTDKLGSYYFLVPKGEYQLEIKKSGYVIDSHDIDAKTYYTNVLTDPEKKKLTFTDSGIICYDLCLKATNPDQKSFKNKRLSYFFFAAIFYLGFALTIFITLSNPTSLNLFITLIYLANVIIRNMTHLGSKWGYVVNKEGTKQPFSAISLLDRNTKQLIARTISDEQGRYILLANSGDYILKTMTNASQFAQKEETITLKERGVVKRKIVV
ncbi:MAG: ELWxxDGT repeat protein [Candidatus Moraniibacteriota bacterium]